MGKSIADVRCHYLKLRRSEESVGKFYDGFMKPSGITLGQCFLLKQISEHEGCSVRQLSDFVLLDRSTLARTLKPLYAARLIHDTKDAGSRNCRLTLTEHGRNTLNVAYSLWEEAQHEFEQRIGLEQINRYEEVLNAIAEL